ncbi:hypothetical protein V5799_013463 [Amblyomma americanum]|uniref:Uncharacterized protein n=1 Tax=Amblyomma americanum TaxID=6943 RepID=A0AAQ4E5Y2_AMBAM
MPFRNITVAQDEFAEIGDVGKRVRDRLDYFADHKTNSYGVVDMECMAYALDQAYVVNVFNLFNVSRYFAKLITYNASAAADPPNNTPSPENVHRFVYLTHVPYSEMLEGRDCVIQTPQVLFRLNTTYQYHREPTSIICVARTNLTYLFSFAVYAIDYDDSDYACPRLSPYGPYSRLRMLYQLRNYLSRHYLNESDEPGCHKVQPKFITPEDFWKIESWPNEGV